MINNKIKISFLFIFGLVIGFILHCLVSNQNVNNYPIETKIITDTIYKELPSKPIIINKVKMKREKVRDTIIFFEPFVATLDTILNKDTLKAIYEFPENFLSLELYRKPDSIMFQTITIYKEKGLTEKWWEKPIYIISGIAGGYILSKLIR